MKTILTIFFVSLFLSAKSQIKTDTVRHLECRCLIFSEKYNRLVRDSTKDIWIMGAKKFIGYKNPFKKDTIKN